jgi:3-oxoadipate enol-lactonase
MRTTANGIQIHYELSGKAGASVVMLSHSLASSMIMWSPQQKALEPDFRVLRYDTRGHGGSEAPEGGYSLALLARDAVGLLDVLGIDSVHFAGLSLGGMIGQGMALDYGNRLKSLVLCDTTAVMPPEARTIIRSRIHAAHEKGMCSQVDETLARWFTPGFLELNPPEVQMIRKQILETPTAGYIGCSEALCGLDTLGRLNEINIPTLIMVGEEDPGTPVAASKAIQERIADSRLVVLPRARHLSNIEQAEAFNRELIAFLRHADYSGQ